MNRAGHLMKLGCSSLNMMKLYFSREGNVYGINNEFKQGLIFLTLLTMI